MKKFTLSALLLVFSLLQLSAQSHCKNQNPNPGILASVNDTRSDSIDILKTTINLNITDFANSSISGNAKLNFKAKVNGITVLRVDLLSLTVDSVKKNNQLLAFNHVNEVVGITLPGTLSANQTDSVVIYYHGQPVTDPSTYGGFYFEPPYAYAIGVGFEAIPHNFGRCWFPTFDNFVERCLFEFNITVSTTNTAVCNGTLNTVIDNGNSTRTFNWTLRDEIPSYLASVAVAPYTSVNTSYPSVAGGSVPVSLYAVPADTNKLKNSFVNLQSAFNTYENRFGPYVWERVGYVLVPFDAGAMEHATNIAYPTFLVNNLTTFEETMAHELSHLWFGDLVTCDKAEEMYLNEGFARYCEAIFLEGRYGYPSYLSNIRANHRQVLNFARAKDGGFYALDAVPQVVTYGATSYEKGADIIHTLRSYMGDSLFFNGLQYYLENNMFQDVNSVTLKTDLEAYSGLELDDFFSSWVSAPGFPQFSIDSTTITPAGPNFLVNVYVRQKLHNAPAFYNNVPFSITFRGAGWESNTQSFTASGQNTLVSFTVPFYPVMANLNTDDKISHAVTAEGRVFKNLGNTSFTNAFMSINATSLTDSAYIYVEHNWVAADDFVEDSDNVTVSPDRYWRVSGILPQGFNAKAVFNYNGRTNSTSAGWLDHGLITTNEDSLILLYRPNSSYPWKNYSYASKNTQGSTTDKVGRFDVDTLKLGEYCFGRGDAAVNVAENAFKATKLQVYPNPANGALTVQTDLVFEIGAEISIISAMGTLVKTITVADVTDKLQLDLRGIAPGVYYLRSQNGFARFVVM